MTTAGAGESELEAVRTALSQDYDVLEELGRGGMAIVYKARERELHRDVAIKVLPFSLTFDADLVERFQREARTAAQLEHPHIVPIYRVGRSGQVIYFVMKLLRGQSLADRLLEEGALGVGTVKRILVETGGALGYAAKRGIVHRDVKPDNIMLDDDDRCIVTDFGIARTTADARLTATGMSLGTPRYMSPEQARSQAVDGRSDIYSLGVVAYEALTGAPPFAGDDALSVVMDHINTPVPQPYLATAEERELYAVIERMLAKKPADRFQSVDELLTALGARNAGSSARASTTNAGATRPSPALTTPVAPASGTPALQQGASIMTERLRQALVATQRIGARGWHMARSRSRKQVGVAASVIAGLIGAYYIVHFASAHRSRCPAVSQTTTAANAGDSGRRATTPKLPPFSVLVDAVKPVDAGDEVDLYYDVCGLPDGATFTTLVNISRNKSGISKLFTGGGQSVSQNFQETADSPAERRHRDIDVSALPAGSYTIRVIATDGKERTRERSIQLQIRARQ